jgi:hypothetical protein
MWDCYILFLRKIISKRYKTINLQSFARYFTNKLKIFFINFVNFINNIINNLLKDIDKIKYLISFKEK